MKELLRKAFIFSQLADSQLGQLATFTTEKHIVRSQVLFQEGEKALAFYFIESGQVKIYRLSDEGQEHILEIHGAGDLVAEAAIFDKQTYPAYCQALEDSLLLRIPKDDFIQLITRNPAIALQVMHGYSKRMRSLVAMVEDLSMHDIKSRLAKYLISHLNTEDDRMICRLPISKRELASLLGTIPETLSRTLAALKKAHIIAEEGDRIIVLDHAKLVALV